MHLNFDFSFWQFLGLKYTTKSNLSFMLENGWFRTTLLYIELTSAVMDSKEPTIYICYRQISVIANIEIKEKLSKWLKNIFCYRQISITGRSVRVGFDCILIHIFFRYYLMVWGQVMFHILTAILNLLISCRFHSKSAICK